MGTFGDVALRGFDEVPVEGMYCVGCAVVGARAGLVGLTGAVGSSIVRWSQRAAVIVPEFDDDEIA